MDDVCEAPPLLVYVGSSELLLSFSLSDLFALSEELSEFIFRSGGVQVMSSLSFLTKAFNFRRMQFDKAFFLADSVIFFLILRLKRIISLLIVGARMRSRKLFGSDSEGRVLYSSICCT